MALLYRKISPRQSYKKNTKMYRGMYGNPFSLLVTFSKGGAITITAERKNNREVIVTIIDSGMGIPAEIRSKLFERFSRKSESGTGLGLFIARSIVEAHGGTINAYNNPSGIGATFSFTLPLVNK